MRLAVWLIVLLLPGIAFAQSATGKVGFELPVLPNLTATGEVTQPPPVIAPEPQTEIAVPLVTQQQSERREPAIDFIRNVWNYFFGIFLRL
jgi:hypothetical protein